MTAPMGGGQNRDVNVTVNANVDPYTKSMSAASDATTKLTDGLKKLDEKIQTIVKRAGIGIGATGGAGLLGMLGSAKEAAQLEKSFESLAAATVHSGESMKTLVGGAKDLSREIPVSTQALAGLMTQVKALGVDGVQNITKLTRVAAELSAATNTAPGALFQGIAELGRSMGTSVQNIERYGSSVTALSQRLGVTADGVVGFANQIQAVANKAGMAETQVLGLAASFQRVGADGFAGASAFNTVINNITDAITTNSSAVNTYANLLGKTREETMALGKENPAEFFVQFTEAIQSQGPRATQVLQQFGLDGVRMQRVIAALTSGQADMRGALGLSSAAYEENTATAKSAAAAWDGTADAFEHAKSAAANLATTVGGPLAEALQPIIHGVTAVIEGADDLMTTLNDLPGPFQNAGSKILGGTFGLLAIGGALTALSWSAIKFLGVWRLVSGVFGIQAFRGVKDGLMGTQRNLDGVSRAGTALYGGSRALGAGLRGNRDGGTGGVGSQAASLAGRGARAVIGFPLTRARQMGREVLDTARYPFSPERRNQFATDPYSVLGVSQAAQRQAARAAEALRTGSVTGPVIARATGFARNANEVLQDRLAARATATAPVAPTGTPTDTRRTTTAFGSAMSRVTASMNTAAGGIATAGRQTITGLGSLARGIGGFLTGPWGLLAMVATPFLISGFQKLTEASQHVTDKLAYTGAEMAQRLNREFVTPEQRAKNEAQKQPADRQEYGKAELEDARSADFRNAYENTIDQLTAIDDKQYQLARLQEEVNRNVQQNNGAPLDEAQQAEIRKLAVSAFGLVDGKNLVGQLDLTGRTQGDFYGQASSAYLNATGSERDSLRDSLASTINTDIADGKPQNAAWTLAHVQTTDVVGSMVEAAKQMTAPGNYGGADDIYSQVGTEATGDLINQMVNDYNANHEDKPLEGDFDVNDIGSFLHQLDEGNKAAQNFADQLRAAGLDVDSSGQLTKESLEGLALSLDTAAATADADAMAQRLQGTTLNQSWQALTGDKNSFINSALGNPNSIDYQQNLNRVGEVAGYEGGYASLEPKDGKAPEATVGTLFDEGATERVRERIRQLTELKNVIGDPNDPTYQALDKLLGAAYGQLGTVTSGVSASPTAQLKEFTSAFKELDVTNPLNAGQFEAGRQQLEQMVQSNLGTLHSYYMQVRDLRRQQAYGEEDHNRQIRHMRRDFDLQMKEANYQRGEQERLADYAYSEQKRQAAYSYSESLRQMKNAYDEVFGNPAAFVQSQYTQGASSAIIGMQRQVEYLQRSLSGLQGLRSMGVDNNVIKLLGLDDPTNFAQVEKYLTDFAANPDLVRQFNETISQRLNIQDALAKDPSNSQLVELDRQFQHSADEAEIAFTHAAEESAKAFTHSMTLSQESFDRGMGDMIESYTISVSRAWDQISRLGEDVSMTTEKLLQWATDSGIAGVVALGDQLTTTIDGIQSKITEMLLGKHTLNGGAWGTLEGGTGTADSWDSATGGTFVMGADGKITLDKSKKQQTTATSTGASSYGASLGGQMGNSLGLGMIAGLSAALEGVAIELGTTDTKGGKGKGGKKVSAIPIQVNGAAVQKGWSDAVGPLKADVDTRWSVGQTRKSYVADLKNFEPTHGVDTTWSLSQTRGSFARDLAAFDPKSQVDTTWSLGQANDTFSATFGNWRPAIVATVGFDTNQVASALSAAMSAAGSSAGGGLAGQAPTSVGGNQKIVMDKAAQKGWTGGEWNALYALINKESGFRNTAQNPTSTAYGMFQFLNSTWATVGGSKTADAGKQTDLGLKYIAQRYGTPSAALAFHNAHNWYAKGGVFDSAQTIGVGEAGPETVLPLNAQGAEFVARTLQASLRAMNVPTDMAELRRQRAGGSYASPQVARTEYHHTDQSTTYTGAITVQASDPREMQRKLDAQRRAQALTRPMARR